MNHHNVCFLVVTQLNYNTITDVKSVIHNVLYKNYTTKYPINSIQMANLINDVKSLKSQRSMLLAWTHLTHLFYTLCKCTHCIGQHKRPLIWWTSDNVVAFWIITIKCHTCIIYLLVHLY